MAEQKSTAEAFGPLLSFWMVLSLIFAIFKLRGALPWLSWWAIGVPLMATLAVPALLVVVVAVIVLGWLVFVAPVLLVRDVLAMLAERGQSRGRARQAGADG